MPNDSRTAASNIRETAAEQTALPKTAPEARSSPQLKDVD